MLYKMRLIIIGYHTNTQRHREVQADRQTDRQRYTQRAEMKLCHGAN